MGLDDHLEQIVASMQELRRLSSLLAATKAPMQHQYIWTCVDDTIVLLSAVANSIDKGGRHVIFTEEKNWHSAMKAVHRSFYGSIISHTEKACIDFLEAKRVNIKSIKKGRQSTADAAMTLIKSSCTLTDETVSEIEEKLNLLVGNQPAFSDYLNAAINNSNLKKKQAATWRRYFRALHIVRSKASHSNPELSTGEVNDLKAGGFADLVSDQNELQLNPTKYKQICEHIILFFDELMA